MTKQKEFKWAKPDEMSFHRYFGDNYLYAFKDKTILIKSRLEREMFVVGLICKDLKTAKEISKLLEK